MPNDTMRARRESLRREHANMMKQLNDLRDGALRIEGAMQILDELIAADEQAASQEKGVPT